MDEQVESLQKSVMLNGNLRFLVGTPSVDAEDLHQRNRILAQLIFGTFAKGSWNKVKRSFLKRTVRESLQGYVFLLPALFVLLLVSGWSLFFMRSFCPSIKCSYWGRQAMSLSDLRTLSIYLTIFGPKLHCGILLNMFLL